MEIRRSVPFFSPNPSIGQFFVQIRNHNALISGHPAGVILGTYGGIAPDLLAFVANIWPRKGALDCFCTSEARYSGTRGLCYIAAILKMNELPSLLLWAKLTVAFTCISLPLKLKTSVFRCGYRFGFEQKFWRIDGFGEKRGAGRCICIPLFTPLLARGQNRKLFP